MVEPFKEEIGLANCGSNTFTANTVIDTTNTMIITLNANQGVGDVLWQPTSGGVQFGVGLGVGLLAPTTPGQMIITNTFTSTNPALSSTYFVIDGSKMTSGNVLDFTYQSVNKFRVNTNGDTTINGNLVSGNNVNAAASSQLYWSGRSSMISPGDGFIALRDTASTSFGALIFGPAGTSLATSYLSTNWPALRVESSTNNVTLGVRRGTNNVAGDYGSFIASNITATGNFVATNASNIRTNIAQLDTINTNWVAGTRYTNATSMGLAARRAKISYSITLTAAAAGTAQMSLYVENPGVITNRTVVSAGPLAGLVTVEQLTDEVGPNEVFYFTDETSGVGGSAAGFAGSGHWKGK